MAVVKSNAYGHDFVLVAKALLTLRSFNEEGWFGVDSIVEALRLRREGITNPILVLGHTVSSRLRDALVHDIVVTISNADALRALMAENSHPAFHLKIDTGMHRQGFLVENIAEVGRALARAKLTPQGVYTHFAAAKDPVYPTYTRMQIEHFRQALGVLQRQGFKGMLRHAAASGGTLLFQDAHFDMVRVGMGMYGHWPSAESKIQFSIPRFSNAGKKKDGSIQLKPVLTWKTVIAEVKTIPRGSYVGYDLTERVHRDTIIAVLPIGYWHGYDRGLSSVGHVIVKGKRAKILGRISMDMTVVDVTDMRGPLPGDEVVLIGRQGKEEITADEIAGIIGTSAYEFLTRVNPLIRRMIA